MCGTSKGICLFTVYVFLIFCLLLGISLANVSNLPNPLFISKELGCYVLCFILLCDLCVRATILHSTALKINLIDLSVVCYLVLLPIVQLFLLQEVVIESFKESVINFIIYLWIRFIFSFKGLNALVIPLFKAVVFVLILNIAVSILQYIGLMDLYNSVRGISGMYFNPGPFSTLISCLLIILISFLPNIHPKPGTKCFYAAVFLSALWVLVQLSSRTSFLSLLVTILLVFLLANRIKIASFFKRKPLFSFSILMVLLKIITILTVIFYNIRPDSVNGRILIWRSTLLMIKDNFWTGIGMNRFKVEFADFQARFLNERIDNLIAYGSFADETHYAFNEYLQVAAEKGVFGILFLLAIYFLCFRASLLRIYRAEKQFPANMIFFAVLVFMGLCSLSSYSVQLVPLNLIFWLIVGFISCNSKELLSFPENLSEKIRRAISPILSVGVFFGGLQIASKLKAYLAWGEFIRDGNKKELLMIAYKNLEYNPDVNRQLGDIYHGEGEYSTALHYYVEATKYAYEIEFLYALGNCYENMGLYPEAEAQYQKVSASIPKLLKPHYLLAKLYHRTENKIAFNKKAREILRFNPHIQNGEVFFMKEEIKNLQKKSK